MQQVELNSSGSVIHLCDRWRSDRTIRALVADHSALRGLCNRLEQLADNLPALPSLGELRHISESLTTLVPRHQADELSLFEKLFGSSAVTPTDRALLNRVRGQHALDELHVHDLAAALEAAGKVGLPNGAEALGYMLRCFFDGYRRALAFEELALLTVAREQFSSTAGIMLGASLARSWYAP